MNMTANREARATGAIRHPEPQRDTQESRPDQQAPSRCAAAAATNHKFRISHHHASRKGAFAPDAHNHREREHEHTTTSCVLCMTISGAGETPHLAICLITD